MNRKGLVTKSTGSWYQVRMEDGSIWDCRLRGKFKLDDKKITNPIAVGDRVNISVDQEEVKKGIIEEILPRENYIIRKSTRKEKYGHIIAANLDQAILVATLVHPRTSLGFIDRFLVSAESYRIPTTIVFNKKDLLDEAAFEQLQELISLYENLGYPCLAVSAFDPKDILSIKNILGGKITLFSGHSGVGKSTLINELSPHIAQRTAEVSSFANKGVHTTTFAEMFELYKDTYIIDTPGIKELGLMEIGEEELSHYFPELRDLIGECRFHNCSHTHEPGCAIEEAFNNGEISASRYESYLSMLEGDDNRR
jgi:ribosome biogenesis GTPase / thiamine phosphate phosphatase